MNIFLTKNVNYAQNEAMIPLEQVADLLDELNCGGSVAIAEAAKLLRERTELGSPYAFAEAIRERVDADDWAGVPYPCLPDASENTITLGWGRTSIILSWGFRGRMDRGFTEADELAVRVLDIPDDEEDHPRLLAMKEFADKHHLDMETSKI